MSTPPLDIRSHLDHINRFLSRLYQDRDDVHRLSDLLRKAGVKDEAIAALRDLLPDYLPRLCQRWATFITETLPERRAHVVIRRFALDGQPPPRLVDLGAEYGICRERVRQMEASGVRRLYFRKRREHLERIAVEVACEVLGLPAEEILEPSAAGNKLRRRSARQSGTN